MSIKSRLEKLEMKNLNNRFFLVRDCKDYIECNRRLYQTVKEAIKANGGPGVRFILSHVPLPENCRATIRGGLWT